MSFACAFSSPEDAESDVEKWRDDGARGRPDGGGFWVVAPGGCVLAVVVVLVVFAAFELARKRDWEWLEK